MVLLVANIAFANTACTPKKKIHKPKTSLNLVKIGKQLADIENNTNNLSIDERRKQLAKIKRMKIKDAATLNRIKKLEAQLDAEEQEMERLKKEKIEKERKAAALKDLQNIFADNDRGNSLKNKNRLDEIKNMGFTDANILEWIKKCEKKLEGMDNTKFKLNKYFIDIASMAKAANFKEANKLVASALKMCKSGDTPVLIKAGSTFGRPMTVKQYLEYIKDQKEYRKQVEDIIVNSENKIIEITVNIIKK